MIRAVVFHAVLLLAAILLTGCAGARNSASAPPPPLLSNGLLPGRHLQTVFLILLENHNWSGIPGSPDAPYINHRLLPQASYATQYFNPPSLHPSLPNYLWLEAGTNCFADTGCIRDDRGPAAHATVSQQHLVTLLTRAHISWHAYEENINGTVCPLHTNTLAQFPAENGVPGLSADLYDPKHDPFVYFDDVTGHLSPTARSCIDNIRPFTELGRDLRSNHVARYNFITPNLCDDMHSSCPVLSNRVKQGDHWLSRVIPSLQASRAYRHGGVIFITWDEGAGGDGPIGMIVLSPDARGHGYHNRLLYTHSSTLRTLEEIFNLRPMLGGAARARDLRDLFRNFP